jgi:hypothetical protein
MGAMVIGERECKQHDIIGQWREGTDVVCHVGLLSADCSICGGDVVGVRHMAPPLRLESTAEMPADVVGWVELEEDEARALEEWLISMRTMVSATEYVALPAKAVVRDPDTKRIIGYRFSCAGFVCTAYEEGCGISLVADEDGLPAVARETAVLGWGHVAATNGLPLEAILPRVGICGEGPWKLLLPAYLFHALSRPRSELPYTPSMDDFRFAPGGAAASGQSEDSSLPDAEHV